jgi:hypothetical protein
LSYADDINILGRSEISRKEKAETLLLASKETGLGVNADKIQYMIMSGVQNAGRNHNMKTENSYFERMEQFKYLGKNLTNQNAIEEKIKSRLKSGNACYNSMQNILCYSLLSKYTKIKINRTVILPVILYGSETWSLIFGEGLRIKGFEKRVLRKIFGP